MAQMLASTGLISARHGAFQAAGLRRHGRPSHFQIHVEKKNNLLTVDQTLKAIETQLQRAKGSISAGNGDIGAKSAQSQPEQTTEGDLKARKQEAREWINSWQDAQGSAEGSEASPASTAESQKVLTEMRKGTTLLTKDQEQAGMERLLNQGTRSVEEENHTEEGSSEAASERSSNGSVEAQSEGGKYAPKETFEDGSVMYSAADLEAVDYEAVSSS